MAETPLCVGVWSFDSLGTAYTNIGDWWMLYQKYYVRRKYTESFFVVWVNSNPKLIRIPKLIPQSNDQNQAQIRISTLFHTTVC